MLFSILNADLTSTQNENLLHRAGWHPLLAKQIADTWANLTFKTKGRFTTAFKAEQQMPEFSDKFLTLPSDESTHLFNRQMIELLKILND